MGHLRDINKMMEESRIRKQKEKEKKKKERIQNYKELCKQANQLLKQAKEEEKKKKMEQLQALVPKRSQKPLNEATEPHITISRTTVYHNNFVERENGEKDLYTTREKLKEAEERCEGRINWELWDKLVEKTRKEIAEITRTYTPPKKERWDNHRYTVYCYDNHLNFIAEYPSTTQCGKAYGIHNRSVSYWIEQNRPHPKLGITFLKHKLVI